MHFFIALSFRSNDANLLQCCNYFNHRGSMVWLDRNVLKHFNKMNGNSLLCRGFIRSGHRQYTYVVRNLSLTASYSALIFSQTLVKDKSDCCLYWIVQASTSKRIETPADVRSSFHEIMLQFCFSSRGGKHIQFGRFSKRTPYFNNMKSKRETGTIKFVLSCVTFKPYDCLIE